MLRSSSEWFVVVVTSAMTFACGGLPQEEGTTTSALTQHGVVKSLSDGSVIPGSDAKLKRKKNRVEVEVCTTLEPNETVDLLWAVFNNPDACTHPNPVTGVPCSPPDLFNPETEGSLHYVATLTADAEGNLCYEATLFVGDTSSCVGGPFPCSGLTDPRDAEIHSPLFVPNNGPGRQAAQFPAP
jgi:hypothetical protein